MRTRGHEQLLARSSPYLWYELSRLATRAANRPNRRSPAPQPTTSTRRGASPELERKIRCAGRNVVMHPTSLPIVICRPDREMPGHLDREASSDCVSRPTILCSLVAMALQRSPGIWVDHLPTSPGVIRDHRVVQISALSSVGRGPQRAARDRPAAPLSIRTEIL